MIGRQLMTINEDIIIIKKNILYSHKHVKQINENYFYIKLVINKKTAGYIFIHHPFQNLLDFSKKTV